MPSGGSSSHAACISSSVEGYSRGVQVDDARRRKAKGADLTRHVFEAFECRHLDRDHVATHVGRDHVGHEMVVQPGSGPLGPGNPRKGGPLSLRSASGIVAERLTKRRAAGAGSKQPGGRNLPRARKRTRRTGRLRARERWGRGDGERARAGMRERQRQGGSAFQKKKQPRVFYLSLIVLPRSCSRRWGPCPSPTPCLVCPFYLFILI